MMATALDERLSVGGNAPPEPINQAYETIKLHIDDLFDTAKGFLDGEPISTQEQADDVSRILDEARKARLVAEAQRKVEAKPFDDGKATVQALWTPLTDEKKGRCALIAETCKKALSPWLKKLEDEKRAAADEARRIAEDRSRALQEAHRNLNPSDLSQAQDLEWLEFQAEQSAKEARRAERDKAQAKGGGRATTLRSHWRAEIADRRAALNHYIIRSPEAFEATIQKLADEEARHGPRTAPGINFIEERIPV